MSKFDDNSFRQLSIERACPEPFTTIHLPPGEIQTWSSRYHFSGDV